MQVVGLDIGYSNVKLVFGETTSDPVSMIFPAGAGPASSYPMSIGSKSTVQVLEVDGEKWVCGVNPSRFELSNRVLHSNYPSTLEYKALFYSALSRMKFDVVDVLVTGLPVDQFVDDGQRERLEELLKGEHQIAPKRTVSVKKVIVIPQPIGAYMDLVLKTKEPKDLDRLQRARLLVVDPGFFSVDWALVRNNTFQKNSSGTSKLATSVILDEAASMIASEYGCIIPKEDIEDAVQRGLETVLVGNSEVVYAPYIESASSRVSSDAIKPLLQSLRTESGGVNSVLITGGGAKYYLASVKDAFPNANIILAEESVLSNARGFYAYGLVN